MIPALFRFIGIVFMYGMLWFGIGFAIQGILTMIFKDKDSPSNTKPFL